MQSFLAFTALVTLLVGTQGQTCTSLVGSGCSNPPAGPPAPFYDGNYADSLTGTDDCDGGQGLFGSFITGVALCAGTVSGVNTQLTTGCAASVGDTDTCNSWLALCCIAAPTSAPTSAPSDAPTGTPTDAPVVAPPSDAPVTSSPSPGPTTSPIIPTESPTRNITSGEACTDFFCNETNVIAVAAGGGGGLLLVVAALLLLRRGARRMDRSESDVPVSAKKAAAAGGGAKVIDDKIFDWEKHIDKKTGEVYFFNPLTNESRWDPPSVTIKN